jgi:hypothetical protein
MFRRNQNPPGLDQLLLLPSDSASSWNLTSCLYIQHWEWNLMPSKLSAIHSCQSRSTTGEKPLRHDQHCDITWFSTIWFFKFPILLQPIVQTIMWFEVYCMRLLRINVTWFLP